MARQKLNHYAFSAAAENVIQKGKPLYQTIKGKWNKNYFQNGNPITLELACGKGEYSIGLARLFPDRNFVGIDIKGDRIARGSRIAMEEGLTNVAFLRSGIQYLHEFFEEDEVDEIWLVHPDPQVRDRDEPKRLTNDTFLKSYAHFLRNGGVFHLKTDSSFLYNYSLEVLFSHDKYEVINNTDNLYTSEIYAEHYGIRTHYEKIFVEKGYKINYIKCRVVK